MWATKWDVKDWHCCFYRILSRQWKSMVSAIVILPKWWLHYFHETKVVSLCLNLSTFQAYIVGFMCISGKCGATGCVFTILSSLFGQLEFVRLWETTQSGFCDEDTWWFWRVLYQLNGLFGPNTPFWTAVAYERELVEIEISPRCLQHSNYSHKVTQMCHKRQHMFHMFNPTLWKCELFCKKMSTHPSSYCLWEHSYVLRGIL